MDPAASPRRHAIREFRRRVFDIARRRATVNVAAATRAGESHAHRVRTSLASTIATKPPLLRRQRSSSTTHGRTLRRKRLPPKLRQPLSQVRTAIGRESASFATPEAAEHGREGSWYVVLKRCSYFYLNCRLAAALQRALMPNSSNTGPHSADQQHCDNVEDRAEEYCRGDYYSKVIPHQHQGWRFVALRGSALDPAFFA